MNLEEKLDEIHARVVRSRFLQLFTVFTRLILAVGFIPPSIKKILHQPFTVMPDSHPVGHYFNALYKTGFYYEFIGWAQLIAAILLLFPRTAHLGALLFLPIIANIAVLTSSVGFVGTNYVTALMFLAALYLVCWEFDRWKPVLFSRVNLQTRVPKTEIFGLPLAGALGGAALASFFAYFGVANIHKAYFSVLLALTVGGFVFGVGCALHHKFMRVGKAFESGEKTA